MLRVRRIFAFTVHSPVCTPVYTVPGIIINKIISLNIRYISVVYLQLQSMISMIFINLYVPRVGLHTQICEDPK